MRAVHEKKPKPDTTTEEMEVARVLVERCCVIATRKCHHKTTRCFSCYPFLLVAKTPSVIQYATFIPNPKVKQ